jgi:predicted  nucleic acid-binding Zn-ribbon protein
MASSFKKKQASDLKPKQTPVVSESNDLNFQLESINNKIESIKEELNGSNNEIN